MNDCLLPVLEHHTAITKITPCYKCRHCHTKIDRVGTSVAIDWTCVVNRKLEDDKCVFFMEDKKGWLNR
jgi:hypothetical protein